jgi:hypothetical protein
MFLTSPDGVGLKQAMPFNLEEQATGLVGAAD